MAGLRLGLLRAAAASVVVLGCSLIAEPQQTPPPLSFAGGDTFQTLCHWPAGTPLAFSGWATWAELGMADPSGVSASDEQVYALVSRERIRQTTAHLGRPVIARAFCWTDGETVGVSAVSDEWVLNRQP
jgi:hypothetical protein